jgi:serine/threonine-protein kinase
VTDSITLSPLDCPECGRGNPPDARFCAGCGHRFGADALDDDADGGADPLLGRTIAERYRIEELLGRGGMGVVYRVEHVRIGKLMAMKLLHGALARDKDVIKRFKREAEAASKLDHANTVQVFDFGQSDGMMYLVMEYLSGRDLGQTLKDEGPLSFDRVARIAAQICGSVAQAHDRGIVHRDLKPENVMLLQGRAFPDFVKVLDFGLAKLRDTEDAERSITRAGSILGTPYYMAPEHIRGEGADARSDVYAVGALMYKAITGVPPFWASSPVGVLTMHLTDEVVPPSEKAQKRDIPPDADRIVLKAMAKSPRDRFQSMEQLRAELLAYLAAVGQDQGFESGGHLRGGVMVSDSGRQREVATRGDVDGYERSLRRRSLLTYALLALVALGLATGGAWAIVHREPPTASTETEPNDTLGQANDLPEGATFRAYLGRRLDEQRSDADFYRLTSPGGRRTIRIEVGAIPNMDVVFEVFRAGETSPLLAADSGRVGEPEVVPNFPIDGTSYYLRVRELWQAGRYPTENVSDAYTIGWRFVEPGPDDEREVNDTPQLAEAIRVGQARRGYIGWRGDRDTYCLAADSSDVVARLSAVGTLDLVLEVLDRDGDRRQVVDAGGPGEGEVAPALDRAPARRTCFVVRAERREDGPSHDADAMYELRLEHGEADRDEAPVPPTPPEPPPARPRGRR